MLHFILLFVQSLRLIGQVDHSFLSIAKTTRFFLLEWRIKRKVINKNISIRSTNAPIRHYFMHAMLSYTIRVR